MLRLRLATSLDIFDIKNLMHLAISELQKGFLSENIRQSREYYSIDLGLQKQLNQQLTVRFSSGYRTQTFSNNSERPESYSVALSLQYIPYSTLW